VINIAEKMKALVKHLRNEGVGGIRYPDIAPQCVDEWSEDYATVCNAYADTYMIEHDFFDYSQLHYEFKQLVRSCFKDETDITVGFYGENYNGGCLQFEACRKRPPADQPDDADGV